MLVFIELRFKKLNHINKCNVIRFCKMIIVFEKDMHLNYCLRFTDRIMGSAKTKPHHMCDKK